MSATPSDQSIGPSSKPIRILSCLQCQRRKVKCDRRSPCSNCERAGVQCAVAETLTSPRPRRRRFPERELLERLRYYEGLLRQNGIGFEPLHQAPGSAVNDAVLLSDNESKEEVDLWRAIRSVTLDHPEHNVEEAKPFPNRDSVINNAWIHRFRNKNNEQDSYQTNSLLFFDGSESKVPALHPEQVQIFKLWQIYLDNINPLLKVTHVPTLQPRIIEAVTNLSNVEPAFEALMFSIYCVSVVSLTDDECHTSFQSSRRELQARYQSSCKQALQKCSPWKSADLDSITAFFLYLISVASQTDPRSLSCTLAVLIRIAQRVGMHRESPSRHSALEAEMRRRLWWSLVLFDHRICELSDWKTTTLVPSWDCKIPINANDFEIRPDMKTAPIAHNSPTEALFPVIRGELFDFIRHSAFHLNFVNPNLKGARLKTDSIETLEKSLDDKFFAFCDPSDPLHYMSIWTVRGSLARHRLLEYYSTCSTSSKLPSDVQRSTALSCALSMIDCDTRLRTSPLTQRFLWFVGFHFPALAHLHILNGLIKEPAADRAEECWTIMNRNYEVLATRDQGMEKGGLHFLFVSFSRVILMAWDARQAVFREQHKSPETPPRMVSDVKSLLFYSSDRNTESDSHENAELSAELMGDHDGAEMLMTGDLDVDLDQFWTDADWRWLQTF